MPAATHSRPSVTSTTTAPPPSVQSPDVPADAISETEVRHLVRIAAAVAVAPIETVRAVMTAALESVSATHVDEVLLQSYLFAGFPRTLNAFVAWRDVSGVPAPATDDASDVSHAPEWTTLGEATCRAVYGPTYDALRCHVGRLHPAIDAWMLADGYGKVLSRPGLPLVVRERCIVAVCAAAGQRPQLGSHLRGARRAGASLAQLDSTLDAIADLAPPHALSASRAELARIASATAATHAGTTDANTTHASAIASATTRAHGDS